MLEHSPDPDTFLFTFLSSDRASRKSAVGVFVHISGQGNELHFDPSLPTAIVADFGQDVKIPCTVDGSPKPKVQWVDERGDLIRHTKMFTDRGNNLIVLVSAQVCLFLLPSGCDRSFFFLFQAQEFLYFTLFHREVKTAVAVLSFIQEPSCTRCTSAFGLFSCTEAL